MKNGQVSVVKEPEEGQERQAAFIVIPTAAGNACFLCHAWGMSEGIKFLETTDHRRIELHGECLIIVNVPQPGFTYELDGTCREVRQEKSALAIN